MKYGLTHEFLDRRDGWPALVRRYGLPTGNVQGIDHGLGYEALRIGSIDIKDAYSTDAKIGENDLVTLEDDLHFFPQYKAVYLYRLSLPTNALAALQKVAGTLDEARMIRLNAEAERTKNYARAAALYFGDASDTAESFSHKLLRWTARHLELAGFSLLLSVLIGVPLGIIASRPGFLSQIILGLTSAIQTIPSLALLALLVPLPFFGISVAHCHRCAFSLRLAADRAQHRHWFAGYSATIARIGHALGLTSRCATAENLICRWRRDRFLPESKRARSSTSGQPRWQR